MSKYRKKYQNVVEKKNHLTYISKDHNTIESLESQALDGFSVEPDSPEFFMQRMGQLHIMSSGKKRYNLKFYGKQTRMLFPAIIKIGPTRIQNLDNFIIKPIEKPNNIIQKPVHLNILNRHKPIKFYKEEKLDNFFCPKTINKYEIYGNGLKLENTQNVTFKSTRKFFNNNPTLKPKTVLEMEYLKIKAPFKCVNSSNVILPLQPKKIKFTNIKTENNSGLSYIIKKTKKFSPASTTIKSSSSLLIPQQPKKTSFKEISTEKTSSILFDVVPKQKTFNDVTIENFPDIFIPEQPKKRYYSVMCADNMSITGSERPEFCLEIDPNEEIFIPNVYDMLLIQNYWDDLLIRSFRVCLRPRNYGKSTRQLGTYDYKNILENYRGVKSEEIKENSEENENDPDKDVSKDSNDSNKSDKVKNENEDINDVNNIYEKRGSTTSNKDDSKDVDNSKINKKGSRFRDLKRKLMMQRIEDDD